MISSTALGLRVYYKVKKLTVLADKIVFNNEVHYLTSNSQSFFIVITDSGTIKITL